MQYRHVNTFSGKGDTPERFRKELRGIAIDNHGRILAAGDSAIKVFDGAGKLVRQWPTSKPPHSVSVAPDESIFVGEEGQIEIFDVAGKLVNTWRDETLLGRVTAIAFTGDSVLAGDAADRAIRHFDRHGKFLNTIGKDNPVLGLLIPNGVVSFGVDAAGTIHTANPGKHRVERYALDGKLLGRIGRFDGTNPEGFGGCCNPTNVAIGQVIYTTEKANPRVKAYDFNGKLLAVIATDAFDVNCKNMSVAVDSRKNLYVVDTVKLAILAFQEVAS